MEKTLPLPKLPTNIIFYKIQLWFLPDFFQRWSLHAPSESDVYDQR